MRQPIHALELPVDARGQHEGVERLAEARQLADLHGIRLWAHPHPVERRLGGLILAAQPTSHSPLRDQLHRREPQVLQQPHLRVEGVEPPASAGSES